MKFMLMTIVASESGPPPKPEMYAAIEQLNEELEKAGVLVSIGGLHKTAKGARAKLSGGKITFTDGPFTEAKEFIGGFAIVAVKSKDEAIELALRALQLHADIMGPDFELTAEIRQMYDAEDIPGVD